jgi:hypothetical protein
VVSGKNDQLGDSDAALSAKQKHIKNLEAQVRGSALCIGLVVSIRIAFALQLEEMRQGYVLQRAENQRCVLGCHGRLPQTCSCLFQGDGAASGDGQLAQPAWRQVCFAASSPPSRAMLTRLTF